MVAGRRLDSLQTEIRQALEAGYGAGHQDSAERGAGGMKMKSNRKDLSSIVAVAFICLVFFFQAKGCVVSLWSPPETAEAYSAEGANGRSMMIVFLPDHETMFWYSGPNSDAFEGVLAEMYGKYGTHYFGPLWHIKDRGMLLGYRLYPEQVEPVHMWMKCKDKVFDGRGDSAFPSIGATSNAIFLFGDDRIKFEGIWLHKTPMDERVVSALYRSFNTTE